MSRITQWHPLSEQFGKIEDWPTFLESIKKTKGNEHAILYRIVDGKKQGLDGRNRQTACRELRLKCKTRCVRVPDEEVEDFIIRCNVYRRHLDADSRGRIVSLLSKEGNTVRDIAGALGVGKSTVQRDLSTNDNASVPNGTNGQNSCVTDKKGRKKKKPAPPPVLCEVCKLKGAVVGCPTCERMAIADKQNKKREKADQASEIVDVFKNRVPKRCRDAYCDKWIPQTYDFLAVFFDDLMRRRIASGMEKRKKHYPFYDVPEFIEGLGFLQQYLEKLLNHLRDLRPVAVCPKCAGKGCAACKQSGLVPRNVYEKLNGG